MQDSQGYFRGYFRAIRYFRVIGMIQADQELLVMDGVMGVKVNGVVF
jgi:hypothetical protein